jgi:hemerythrin-like domain-containing protein
MQEQTGALTDLLATFDTDTAWDRINEIIGSFDRVLTEHFDNEENLIALLQADPAKLSDDERQVLFEITEEHKILLSSFTQLCGVAEEYEEGNREVREALITLARDIIDRLLAHAGKEDAFLFPLLRKYVPDDQLRILRGDKG